jgi:hypothetical protein
MKLHFFPCAIVLIVCFLMSSDLFAADECVDCHRQKTAGAVRIWQASAHAGAGVGCAVCHGSDHQRIEKGEAYVDAKVCGRCHAKALQEHAASRHGMGLHTGWGCTRSQPNRDPKQCRFCHEEGSTRPVSTVQCARFLKQTNEMAEIGCNNCHKVENACGSCHSNHATDLKIVRDPAVCAKCHMGPDHAQWEMWQTSQHGTLFASAGEALGPTCQTCHQPGGSHNVSRGLTSTPGMAPYPAAELAGRRDAMLQVCVTCHAEKFARSELARGDAVRTQSLALVKEAEKILWDLADRGLLDPDPKNRPPHPFAGHNLVTDSQQLYEDTSHIERLFFKMKKYDLAKTVKGAYHQNPAYAHWYGNAELKMDLIDIRAEADRLRRRGEPVQPAAVKENAPAAIESELRALKNKFDRGALSADAYGREKQKLLGQLGE